MSNDTLISAIEVSHAVGSQPLFNELSFTIQKGDRISLVGTNGTGKSTLLKILAREVEPLSGRIVYRKGTWVEYVPQFVPSHLLQLSVLDGVKQKLNERGFADEPWRAEIALELLGVRRDLWSLNFSELSGGEANRALLARAVAGEPSLLLLDEPTNHLDSEGIVEFERLLNNELDIPFCIVSHDRELLDRCTHRTLILRDERIYSFSLPYSGAREALAAEDAAAAHLQAQRELEFKKKKAAAQRLQQWAKLSDSLAPRYKAAVTEMERAKEKLDETFMSRERRREVALDIRSVKADRIVCVEGVSVRYGDRELFTVRSLEIRSGDRVALLGRNGAGKSSFIRLLVSAYSGTGEQGFTFNPRAKVGYYDQELSTLHPDSSVINHIANGTNLSKAELTALLARAGFMYEMHSRTIASLSGGERARLQFLALKLLNPTLLILDEPTNHIDVQGCESLEDQLLETDGACLFVSHDRRFVKTVANRYLLIDGGSLREIFEVEEYYRHLSETNTTSEEIVREVRERKELSEDELLLQIDHLEAELREASSTRATVLDAHLRQLYTTLDELIGK